nr:FtsX-like permease family protein [Nitrosomonas nitrosa]
MLATYLKIAARNLSRNKRKSLITLLAVVCGAVALIVAGGFFDYMFYANSRGAIYGQYGHLQVYARGYLEKGVAEPFDHMIHDFDQFKAQYGSLSKIKLILPRLQFPGLAAHGETTVPFVGLGIDPEKESAMASFSTASGPTIRITDGRYLEQRDQTTAILGKGLSQAIGARIGDSITLISTSTTGAITGVTVVVVGIFESFQKEFDDHYLEMPIKTAQELMKIGKDVQTAVFILEDQADPRETAAALQVAFKSHHEEYEIRTWTELALFYNATVDLFKRMFSVINVVIGLIVILGITNAITMSIFERTREIGTTMAIGTRPSLVVLQYVLEGVMIGVCGGIAGCLIGWLVASAVSLIGIPMPPPPGGTRPWVALITPPLGTYMTAFCTSVVTGILASLWPAVKASRLNIVEALRYV